MQIFASIQICPEMPTFGLLLPLRLRGIRVQTLHRGKSYGKAGFWSLAAQCHHWLWRFVKERDQEACGLSCLKITAGYISVSLSLSYGLGTPVHPLLRHILPMRLWTNWSRQGSARRLKTFLISRVGSGLSTSVALSCLHIRERMSLGLRALSLRTCL